MMRRDTLLRIWVPKELSREFRKLALDYPTQGDALEAIFKSFTDFRELSEETGVPLTEITKWAVKEYREKRRIVGRPFA